jgi:hypothetical protein
VRLILAFFQDLVGVVVGAAEKEIGGEGAELADFDDPAPFSAWSSRMSSNCFGGLVSMKERCWWDLRVGLDF